jgi:hypothetical protein
MRLSSMDMSGATPPPGTGDHDNQPVLVQSPLVRISTGKTVNILIIFRWVARLVGDGWLGWWETMGG